MDSGSLLEESLRVKLYGGLRVNLGFDEKSRYWENKRKLAGRDVLRCTGEAVSLYSGSFKDRRVLSFMYESFEDGLEYTGQTQWGSQAPASALPPSHCVAPS